MRGAYKWGSRRRWVLAGGTTCVTPRIYLAGPEVFLLDALEVGGRKSALCAAHGFEGVFPLDASLGLTGVSKPEQARRTSVSAVSPG